VDNFSSRLSDAVARAGMTQQGFAERMGVSVPTAYRWMSGGMVPRKTMLFDMAKLLNVTPEWLQTGNAESVPVDADSDLSKISTERLMAELMERLSKAGLTLKVVSKEIASP
jgi:transcriptional regulator with XRE-family HTH domain